MPTHALFLNCLQGLCLSEMIHSKSFKSTPPTSQHEETTSPFMMRLSASALKQSNRIVKNSVRRFQNLSLRNQVAAAAGLLGSILSLQLYLIPAFNRAPFVSRSVYPPLAMSSGDPYIRALMRTISVSESNDPNPYGLLYGGAYFSAWEKHPDRCIPIVAGPNVGDCTTAAGRYQFITSTWQEKAQQYHPNPQGWLFWQQYTFDPESQDRVVYRWLVDTEAWNMDIRAQLKAGQLRTVLKTLSGTWTSLGYGIETNEMTPYLSEMYQKFLREEKVKAG
jgi:muramidase (phage lysozyme)